MKRIALADLVGQDDNTSTNDVCWNSNKMDIFSVGVVKNPTNPYTVVKQVDSTLADKKAKAIDVDVEDLLRRVRDLETTLATYEQRFLWNENQMRQLRINNNICKTCGFIPRYEGEGHYHYTYNTYNNHWLNIYGNSNAPINVNYQQEWVEFKW